MDIEHPDITRINRFGYHDPEAFDYELRLMTDEYTEDEEIWPDGLTWDEWQDMKKRSLVGSEREPSSSGVE
jgi:hypothetical protein